eukprot:TRINITY_DN2933_c1_g1_i1.p1 TRINITY_DN2933_c1_g1~~TRINITY_DN2933_c1_g1_i1.p1  ORF type:complete len:473 (-),score=20.25 TRINITY_DN2933_c1_g1_i1:373-1791(-)
MMASNADLTVCVRHIPCKILEPDILDAIASFGLDAGRYEIYLPKRPGRHGRLNNFGYGFVTGREQEDVDSFTRLFHGFQFENIGSEKRLHIEPRLVSRPCGPSRLRNGSQMNTSDGAVDNQMTSLNANTHYMNTSSSGGAEWSPSSESFLTYRGAGTASHAPSADFAEEMYQINSSHPQGPWGPCRSNNFFAHSDPAPSMGTRATYMSMDAYYHCPSAASTQGGAYRSNNTCSYSDVASLIDGPATHGEVAYYNHPAPRGICGSTRPNEFPSYGDQAASYDSVSPCHDRHLYHLRSSTSLGAYDSSRSNNFSAYSDTVAPLVSPIARHSESFSYRASSASEDAFQGPYPNDYSACSADAAPCSQGFQSLGYQTVGLNPSTSNGVGGHPCSTGFGSVAWSNTQSVGVVEERGFRDSPVPIVAAGSSGLDDFRAYGAVATSHDTPVSNPYWKESSPPEAGEIPTTRLLGFAGMC